MAIAAALLLLAANINHARAAEIELTPGRLKAEIRLPADGAGQASGSRIFVDIALTTRRRRDEAQFDLTVTGGEIIKITGKRLDISGRGASRQVTVNRLRRRRTRNIKVEIRLGPPAEIGSLANDASASTDLEQTAAATLQLTLHDPESEDSEDFTARWPLTFCARNYHLGLSQISTGIAKKMLAAQARLRTKDKSLPGYWLTTSRRLGRPRLNREERKVVRFLAEFVDRRGYAPEFGDNGRYRWLTYRVSNDLNNYITQPIYPALCTGANQLLTFHKRNMRGFHKRTAQVLAIVEQAKKLAKGRVEAVFNRARETKLAWLTQQREQERQRAAAAARTAELAAAQATAQSAIETDGQKNVASATGDSPAPASKASSDNGTTPFPGKASLQLQKPVPSISNESVAQEPQKVVPDSYLAMIKALAAVALPAERRFEIGVETKPLPALRAMLDELRKVKARLWRPRGRYKRGRNRQNRQSNATGQPLAAWNDRKVFYDTLAALQLIEAGIYADKLSARYQGINDGIDKTIAAIDETHKRNCTCGNE